MNENSPASGPGEAQGETLRHIVCGNCDGPYCYGTRATCPTGYCGRCDEQEERIGKHFAAALGSLSTALEAERRATVRAEKMIEEKAVLAVAIIAQRDKIIAALEQDLSEARAALAVARLADRW